VRILKKTVADNQRNWHNSLHNSLWDGRVTPKEAIGNSPYFMVYEQEAILPNGLYLPSLQLTRIVEDNHHQLYNKESIPSS
jgi:hypothetical protein